jgi:NitT/TauT family transport system permease protein
MGSYIAEAIVNMNGHAIVAAIVTMLVVIFLYDQCVFRPLVAWGEKFKADEVTAEVIPHSWVIDVFQRTRVVLKLGKWLSAFADAWVNIRWFRRRINVFPDELRHAGMHRYMNVLWNGVLLIVAAFIVYLLAEFIFQQVGVREVGRVFVLGLMTGARIFILLLLVSCVWVPVGVWIGLRPRVSYAIQPVVQFLASFPANLLFPVVVWFIVRYQLNVEVWTTPLMMLGAQWYVLFNVVSGTAALPKELLQAADNLGVKRWLRFRRVIFPGIFPYYITGAITAVGAAWNASIVAEVVSWGDHTLVATGLGAYIAMYTVQGDFPRIALGIGVMCFYVLLLNRVVWRPLYRFAESRYRLA